MTRSERRRAALELQQLLPLAWRAAAEAPDYEVKGQSPTGARQLPYLRIENVVGVFIYARFGGWYADVLLDPKELPPSSPTAFGTPMHLPLKTREEAEASAVGMLAICIANSRQPAEKPVDDGKRYFGFFGIWLQIPADVDTLLNSMVRQIGYDPATQPQFWLGRLDTLKREAFGDAPVTGEAWDALPEEMHHKIWTACAVVWSRLNLLRYPNEPEGPP